MEDKLARLKGKMKAGLRTLLCLSALSFFLVSRLPRAFPSQNRKPQFSIFHFQSSICVAGGRLCFYSSAHG
jgi:hypothetical protein